MKCMLCSQEPCSDYLANTTAVLDETPPTERMYTVLSELSEDGRLLYHPGHKIPLQEAVLRGLPGAREQATGVASPENRDALTGAVR